MSPKHNLLQIELNRITKLLSLPEMKVIWLPDNTRDLSGEVKGTTIFIYDQEYEDAAATLRHEVVDYLLCKAIDPYKQVLNALVKTINANAYRQKEEIVDHLSKLLLAESKV